MKIIKCSEIPQWIIESDKAAYHPYSNTIYLIKWVYLLHELIHWMAYKLSLKFIHQIIDGSPND